MKKIFAFIIVVFITTAAIAIKEGYKMYKFSASVQVEIWKTKKLVYSVSAT